jgi:arsenate reductase
VTASGPRQVLFVCVENSCRSLMAEAIFAAHAPAGWVAASAGTRPAATPNPRTLPMLAEIGLRLPDHAPRLLTPDLISESDMHVTMGCLDDASCPIGLKAVEPTDWGLPDPARLDAEGFRRVRDEIVVRVLDLTSELERKDRLPRPSGRSSPP